MAFQPGAFQADAFQGAAQNVMFAVESGYDSFSGVIVTETTAIMAAVESGADVASFVIDASTTLVMAAQESGADTFSGVGPLALMFAVESGADTFSATGDSEGNVVLPPRDVTGEAVYLVEMGAAHRQTGAARTFRFSPGGYNTRPTDTPANTYYEAGVDAPGQYSRTLFSAGTTSGEITVGAGYIEIINSDGGFDELRDYAVDGYPLRILTLDGPKAAYSTAERLFAGTVEQVELSWDRAKILIRDRLAELKVDLQTTLFAGTTVAGGMNEAEGLPQDLKDKPKPLNYGAPPLIVPAVANSFDKIFAAGADGLDGIAEVRDKGVLITASGQDYTTVAALRTASIASGKYATALNLGLLRTGDTPQGQVTCAPIVGANAAARTAAQLSRRVLLRKGFVENVNFLAKDVARLDALNSAEVGYFVGTEPEEALTVVGKLLGSIGATIVPDRLGVFRMLRMQASTAYPVVTITEAQLIEDSGDRRPVRLLATGDEGRGVPAWKVTVKYAHNGSVMTANDLDPVNVSTAFRAFATEEWRTVTATDPAVKAIHKLAPELTFETYLVSQAAAQAEANRLLALHGVRRDRFQVTLRSTHVASVDLNSAVALKLDRFGLSAGKTFTVIGLAEDYRSGLTTLDLWG